MDSTSTIILFIGDAQFTEAYYASLHATDYDVEPAHSLEAATSFVATRGPDVALFIIAPMPQGGQSGTEILKKLRHAGAMQPAIVLSMDDTTPHLATLAGENRMLPPTVAEDELRKAVEELLSDSSTYV